MWPAAKAHMPDIPSISLGGGDCLAATFQSVMSRDAAMV